MPIWIAVTSHSGALYQYSALNSMLQYWFFQSSLYIMYPKQSRALWKCTQIVRGKTLPRTQCAQLKKINQVHHRAWGVRQTCRPKCIHECRESIQTWKWYIPMYTRSSGLRMEMERMSSKNWKERSDTQPCSHTHLLPINCCGSK